MYPLHTDNKKMPIEKVNREVLIKEWSILNPKSFEDTFRSETVWWEHYCECGELHRWQTKKNSRMRAGTKCPYCTGQKTCICRSLYTLYPELAAQLDDENNISAKNIGVGYSKELLWKCPKGHTWKNKVCSRVFIYRRNKDTNRCSCPYCGNKRVNKENNISENDIVIKYWDYTKNSDLNLYPENYTYGSNKKVWWLCDNNHSFECGIRYKIKNKLLCPYCSNKKVCIDNCLETDYPKISKEWDYTKNSITPRDITYGSHKKAWWICEKGHSYSASIYHRTKNMSGCPICKTSKGERIIKEYLDENDIEYIPQYKIRYRDMKRSSLDFYLAKYNLAIEYDGIQHFEPREHFGGEDQFAIQVKNDLYKEKYCKKEKINLLKIHYKDKIDIPYLISNAITVDFHFFYYSHSYFPNKI